MDITSLCLTREEKKKLEELKKRTRSTYRKTIELLVSLYKQLAPPQRGEEVEFVEAVERGEVISFLRERLCDERGERSDRGDRGSRGCRSFEEEEENKVKAVVRRTDGREVGEKKSEKIEI